MVAPTLDESGYHDFRRECMKKIRTLSELAWDGKCQSPEVDLWLQRFDGRSGVEESVERIHMLLLLSNFLYFGHDQIRELLRALYRDVFQYHVIERIRKTNQNTTDGQFIQRCFQEELCATRFVPLGGPSESSNHLLYDFRQVNNLPEHLLVDTHQMKSGELAGKARRCIFIDDFAGTGNQAIEYSATAVAIREALAIPVEYYVLIATPEAVLAIEQSGTFNDVRCVLELPQELRAFSDESLFYMNVPAPISKDIMRVVALAYGEELMSGLMLPSNAATFTSRSKSWRRRRSCRRKSTTVSQPRSARSVLRHSQNIETTLASCEGKSGRCCPSLETT